MHIEFSGKNIEITKAIRSEAEKYLNKLQRVIGDIEKTHITLEVNGHINKAELALHAGHDAHYKASAKTDDMYKSIKIAVGAIEIQAKKKKKKRFAERVKKVVGEVEDFTNLETPSVHVKLRNDLFYRKPLSIQDASMMLDQLKEDIIVFRTGEYGNICVLFRDLREGLSLVEVTKEE